MKTDRLNFHFYQWPRDFPIYSQTFLKRNVLNLIAFARKNDVQYSMLSSKRQ